MNNLDIDLQITLVNFIKKIIDPIVMMIRVYRIDDQVSIYFFSSAFGEAPICNSKM